MGKWLVGISPRTLQPVRTYRPYNWGWRQHQQPQDERHRYNIGFRRLDTQTGWNDSVLQHCYYSGLAEKIKDIMGTHGKPTTLDTMKALAHSIDACHWERVQEKSHSGPDKTNHNINSVNNKSDQKSVPYKPNNNRNQSKAFSSSSNSNNKSKSIVNLLLDKLGKDGKLTPQEKQCRFDNQLCLFCGGAGHTAKECMKASSSASKVKGFPRLCHRSA